MRYVLLHSRTDVLKFAQSVHEWSTIPSKNGWDGAQKGSEPSIHTKQGQHHEIAIGSFETR